jgi:hypothetical protein
MKETLFFIFITLNVIKITAQQSALQMQSGIHIQPCTSLFIEKKIR